jgi:hypothetical protein
VAICAAASSEAWRSPICMIRTSVSPRGDTFPVGSRAAAFGPDGVAWRAAIIAPILTIPANSARTSLRVVGPDRCVTLSAPGVRREKLEAWR